MGEAGDLLAYRLQEIWTFLFHVNSGHICLTPNSLLEL